VHGFGWQFPITVGQSRKDLLNLNAENFKLKIAIGYFTTKIFHPNVAVPSGEICVNTLKKDWNP
jgi:hypothetical protein